MVKGLKRIKKIILKREKKDYFATAFCKSTLNKLNGKIIVRHKHVIIQTGVKFLLT